MTENFDRDYKMLCDRTLKKMSYMDLSKKYKISSPRSRQIIERMVTTFKKYHETRETYKKLLKWAKESLDKR